MKKLKEIMKKRNAKIVIFSVMIWTIVIFAFSLQPGEISSNTSLGFGRWLLETFVPTLLEYMESLSVNELAQWHHVLRKCAHFTEYMILGMLAVNAMAALAQNVKKWCWWYPWCYCILVAWVDETIQKFVPGRAGMMKDVRLDSAGALVGTLLLFGILYQSCIRKNLTDGPDASKTKL